jgi:tetratricopeptide (TPR) repeat protein
MNLGGAMGDEPVVESRRFGRYLRTIREQRKLSLDVVEEMSLGFPERITKSHLSRIENGRAVPSFPRMFALSQIYGVPITSVAEKFETDLQLEMQTVDLAGKTADVIQRELEQHKEAGRYQTALALAQTAIENMQDIGGVDDAERFLNELRLYHINCLVHLGRYESAKVDCESLLSSKELSKRQHLWALLSFVTCCYRLKRYNIAEMGLAQADEILEQSDHPDRMKAKTETIRGPVRFAMGRIEDAAESFSRAIDLFRILADPFEESRARINLAQALIELGELKRARKHLTAVLKNAEKSGYNRLEALALSHLALTSYKMNESGPAEAYALRSNAIARPREYHSILFRNCFYLRGIAEQRGDRGAVRSNERTLNTYLSRVEADMPEAIAYRTHLAGGEQ